MVNYVCYRCGFETHRKGNIRNHINRKYKCSPIVRDIDVTEYSTDILDGRDFNDTASPENRLHLAPSRLHLAPSRLHLAPSEKTHNCPHCNRTYSHSRNLAKHLKACIANKTAHKIKEQEKEIEELKQEAAAAHQMHITTNNTTNNITMINIEANKSRNYFSKTDYSVISGQKIRKAAVRAGSSIQEIVKTTHFDPQHPENQNIFISSLKSGLALIFEDDQWNVRPWGDVVDRLIDNGQITMDEWLGQGSNRIDYPVENAGVKRLHELRTGEDAAFFAKRMDTQLKHVVYNNRAIPQSEASVKKLHQMTLDNPDL